VIIRSFLIGWLFKKSKEEETATYTSFVQPKGEIAGPMNSVIMVLLVFDTYIYSSVYLCVNSCVAVPNSFS